MRGLASPHPILGAICELSAVAVHQHRRRHPFRAANADSHGPDYSADYGVSTVAVLFRCLMSLLCWSCCVRNVRVHSSSCGAHRDVHSPLDWLDHRCHCKCRDLVLFVGRLRRYLRRDVVWWWIFHSWWCLRFGLGQCEADDWKLRHQLFPVPRGRWVCLHAQ